ncbi:radical SAM/SPASM domain-containing protein [Vibrio halioticoli]|nr:radical SAM/SPASM domain-containing protein [Vibrio halioticoli]
MEEILLVFNSFPQTIEIQTFSKCNADCSICPYESVYGNVKHQYMEMDLIQGIVEQAAENGARRIIPYLNNEPTLDSRFLDILRLCKSTGLEVEISSNGTGLSEKRIQTILEEGLIDDFRVSFFGGQESTYQALMPKLNFQRSLEKIKRLHEMNAAHDSPMDIQLIMVLVEGYDFKKEREAILTHIPDAHVRFFGFLDRAGSVPTRNNNKVICPDNMQSLNYKVIGCKLERHLERMSILNNGNVILCSQDWKQERVLGNVRDSSIKSIWNGDKYLNERRMIHAQITMPTQHICNRCKLAILEDTTGQQTMNFLGDRYVEEDDTKKVGEIL